METEGHLETNAERIIDEAEAIGGDFGSLMRRLNEELGARMAQDEARLGLESVRRQTAAAFLREADELIARHRLGETIAEYVRHVVREGFEVAFDSMDPTDEALRAQKKGAPASEFPGTSTS